MTISDQYTSGWLRLENLAIAIVTTALYFLNDGSLTWFLVLFLVPDISMLGYLAGKKTGAHLYNLGHSYVGPAALLITGTQLYPTLTPYALIWIAHIGIDRVLGFGLKQTTGFKDTHLGRVGGAA